MEARGKADHFDVILFLFIWPFIFVCFFFNAFVLLRKMSKTALVSDL